MNARDALKFNRTVFNAVLAPLIVAAVLGLAGWGWWLHAGDADQENHRTKHDRETFTSQRTATEFCGSYENQHVSAANWWHVHLTPVTSIYSPLDLAKILHCLPRHRQHGGKSLQARVSGRTIRLATGCTLIDECEWT